jgi:hypothetical protein
MYCLISHSHEFKFDADFLTPSPITRIDSMAMRLAVVLLFLYSTPILSAAQPVPEEPDAARERLMSFIED